MNGKEDSSKDELTKVEIENGDSISVIFICGSSLKFIFQGRTFQPTFPDSSIPNSLDKPPEPLP